jgi:hypothetical protein
VECVREGEVSLGGVSGEADSLRAWRPWVLEEDDGTLRMWYSGNDGKTWRILEAVQRGDGTWGRLGVAIDARSGWWTPLDDHARFLLAARAALRPTTEAAWACFEEAATRHGMPRQLISDNGCASPGAWMAGWSTSSAGSARWGSYSSTPGPTIRRPWGSWSGSTRL